jgi:hypothetical protein
VSKCLPGYPGTLKADIAQYSRHVSKVPNSDTSLAVVVNFSDGTAHVQGEG